MEKRLISVIVPIYKVEAYIHECIDSILAQTYKNLEIILIDDGSPDSCPQICDEYAKKDSRIIVIHKENGGLSSARNAGIKISKGELLGFIDSDDYPQANMFEELYKSMSENNADISICGVRKFGLETKDEFYGKKCLNKQEFMKSLLSEEVKSYTWNKLYKKELFDGIEFPVGELFEDMRILHLLGEKVSSVSFTDKTHYNYRIRENSITTDNKGKKADSYRNATHLRSERYRNTELYSYAVAGEFKCLRVIVSDMAEHGENNELKADLFAEAKQTYRICKNNISGFQKLISFLFFLSPKMYAMVKKLYLKS